jgi:hypothetical protein
MIDLTSSLASLALRISLACSFCLALTGCFFVPGSFRSTLDIRRDGHFTYTYKGTVAFLLPGGEQVPDEPWSDSMAQCQVTGTNKVRPCNPDEIASKKSAYEAQKGRDREAAEDLAQVIGFNPIDPKANERFAKELTKYPGWKKVEYLGSGQFDIDYHLSGTLDRDFAFPVVPQVQTTMPFVLVARNKAAIVNLTAAGLASQQMRRTMRKILYGQLQLGPNRDDDGAFVETERLLNKTNGVFVVTTDAKVGETNGKQSIADGVNRVEWAIDGKTSEAPELQLLLDFAPDAEG